MKSRKEYIILCAVVVVLVIYLVFRQSDRTLYELPEIKNLEDTEITKLEINKPGEKPIRLEKTEGRWMLMPLERKGAEKKIDKMADAVKGLELTALVSESENYVRYKLGEDREITVKAWSEEGLARQFSIGKTAPSYSHTFVRLPGSTGVYQASGNLRTRFEAERDELRDKTVLAPDPAGIESIAISRGSQKIKIRRAKPEGEKDQGGKQQQDESGREKTRWEYEGGGSADPAAVEDFLEELSNLKCREYIYKQNKSDFSDPVYTVELKGPAARSLSIFARESEDDDAYPAVSSDSKDPFLLSSYKAENIMGAFEKD